MPQTCQLPNGTVGGLRSTITRLQKRYNEHIEDIHEAMDRFKENGDVDMLFASLKATTGWKPKERRTTAEQPT